MAFTTTKFIKKIAKFLGLNKICHTTLELREQRKVLIIRQGTIENTQVKFKGSKSIMIYNVSTKSMLKQIIPKLRSCQRQINIAIRSLLIEFHTYISIFKLENLRARQKQDINKTVRKQQLRSRITSEL